jgi:methylmalonyl-CoA mutase
MLIDKRIEQFVNREGRRPRILVSSIDKDSHDQETKLLATFFAENGFDVDIGPLHQTPQHAARTAIENDVHAVCFLSTAKNHKELVTDLVKLLNAENGGDIQVVIGGDVPPSDYDFLYEAGVGLIFNSGPANFRSIIRLLDMLEPKPDKPELNIDD